MVITLYLDIVSYIFSDITFSFITKPSTHPFVHLFEKLFFKEFRVAMLADS